MWSFARIVGIVHDTIMADEERAGACGFVGDAEVIVVPRSNEPLSELEDVVTPGMVTPVVASSPMLRMKEENAVVTNKELAN
jgi:hypothetical protein